MNPQNFLVETYTSRVIFIVGLISKIIFSIIIMKSVRLSVCPPVDPHRKNNNCFKDISRFLI